MKKKIILFILIASVMFSKNLNFYYHNNDLLIEVEPSEFSKTANDNLLLQSKNLGHFVPLTGNLEQMKYFDAALDNIKNKQVRIAHYGDSLILGDIITEYLREKFQQKYGGQGCGFLNIVSDDYRMRRTTIHSYSDDWEYVSFLTRNPNMLPLGISGALAIPKIGSWVKYEVNPVLKSSSSFSLVKIYYSNASKNSQIQYSIDGNSTVNVNLEDGNDLKEFDIETNNNSKKIYIKFISGKSPVFYGVSLESKQNGGVYVDNFPMRGNTGASLYDIPDNLLSQFNKDLHYDLIILNYGTNVSSGNKGIFNVYENKMVNVIEKFKKAFPKTSILLVSASDRTKKIGPNFVTDPDVFILLDAQKSIVQKTGIAFWNMHEMMGGNNSMNDWVNASPPHALKDYSHFTTIGGEVVASYLFDAIIQLVKK